MTEPVLIDTGPLVAVLAPKDAGHARCVPQFHALRRPPIATWPVLTEAAWLLRNVPRGATSLLALVESGAVAVDPLGPGSAATISKFMTRYASIGAQLADASLVEVADRLNVGTIFTLDLRDFSVYRRSNGAAFQIIPTFE